MCDRYNGWTNRETWTLDLWLSNDEGLYNMTRERVTEALNTPSPSWVDVDQSAEARGRMAGEAVREFWEEITDPDEQMMTVENILAMVRDIGSEHRVNWDEIGKHWADDMAGE